MLVTGGAGRVGYYAIQWAKLGGASVIATASNAADKDLCLQLGADAVVNHREENWGELVVIANAGHKVDRVVEVEFGAVKFFDIFKVVHDDVANLVVLGNHFLNEKGYFVQFCIQVHAGLGAEHGVELYEILIVLGWTFIFIYGSYYLLKIRDL